MLLETGMLQGERRRPETEAMTYPSASRLVLMVACLAALVGVAWPGAVVAQDAPAATPDGEQPASKVPYMLDARIVGDDKRIRFVADMSATVDAAVFALADPYRVIIDLPEVRFVMPDKTGEEGRGFVSAFRYGSISAGKSRIVIDARGPVTIDKQFIVQPTDGQPARFVVDLVPTTRDRFLEAAKAYRDSHSVAVEGPGQGVSAGGEADHPLIVIDPGHGGIDLGARGNDGALEKNLVLAFGKALGAKLIATNRYRVVFTRRDDTFVSLGDRVNIARRQNADLFVSIHANSFPGSAVRGAIIYTASEKASDSMAAGVADAENQSDALAGIDVASGDSDQVKNILVDLTRRETRNFGVVFAQNLIKNLGKTTRMFKIPHQEANFKVLEAPDVPSALVELGYLTNPDDEKQLVSDEWQQTTAGSMVDAIDAYFSRQKMAKEQP